MIKIDKFYFVWLQIIANKNQKFNILIYEEIIHLFNDIEDLYNKSKSRYILYNCMKDINIDNSIIESLSDDNIKEECRNINIYLIEKEYSIITYEEEKYPKKLKGKVESPFFFICRNDIDINNKNIYVYFNSYFTRFAKKLTYYFVKIINQENLNVFSEYKNENIRTIDIDYINNFNFKNMKSSIILPSKKYIFNFFINVIDICIIIEARYEETIVNLINNLLDCNKEICVVPSNIFKVNSYFSNYLIKQGAEVILNKSDLKFILNNIIG